MSMSEENKQKSAAILSGKKGNQAPPELKKRMRRTVKDIANIALKEVEEKREQAAKRPVPQPSVVEQQLHEIEEKLEAKNKCKYRKSCYESGKLPEIESTLPSWFSLPSVGVEHYIPKVLSSSKDERDDELKEKDPKLYCKYRKSCYETGELPEIEPSLTYEYLQTPRFFATDSNKPAPTTLDDLRLQCKYRTSCYRTRAQDMPSEPEIKSADESEKRKSSKEVVEEPPVVKTKKQKHPASESAEEKPTEEEPSSKEKKKSKRRMEEGVPKETESKEREPEVKKQKAKKPKVHKEPELVIPIEVPQPDKSPKKQKRKVESKTEVDVEDDQKRKDPVKTEPVKPSKSKKVHIDEEKVDNTQPEKVAGPETPTKIPMDEITHVKCKYRKS